MKEVPKYIKDCISRYLTTVVYSLMPIIIGTIVLSMLDNQKGIITGFTEQASPGELFIWSATVMAGVAYNIIKDPPVKYRGAFGFYCVVLLIIATIHKTLTTAGLSIIDLTDLSYIFSVTTAIVLFINMFMEEKIKSNPAGALRKESEDYANGYAKRRAQ